MQAFQQARRTIICSVQEEIQANLILMKSEKFVIKMNLKLFFSHDCFSWRLFSVDIVLLLYVMSFLIFSQGYHFIKKK